MKIGKDIHAAKENKHPLLARAPRPHTDPPNVKPFHARVIGRLICFFLSFFCFFSLPLPSLWFGLIFVCCVH